MRRTRSRRFGFALAVVAAAVLAVGGSALAGHGANRVAILDDCEPASFDAVLGHGACVGHGTKTFQDFIGQLVTTGDAPAWRFDPHFLRLMPGGAVLATNFGGEFHTFSEVANFGGGCVQALNDILGLQPVPECDDPAVLGTTGVDPGQTRAVHHLSPGVHRFECLIHPWMRTTVVVG
jgi:plastocyanin